MSIEATTSNGLTELAGEINTYHRHVEAALTSALEYAIRAGRALMEAKARCAHGEWLPWLEEHFEGSERTAQAYMRVARHYSLEDLKNETVADLSYREALKELSEPATDDRVDNVNESEPAAESVPVEQPVAVAESAWKRHIKDVTGFSACETPEEFLEINRPYLDEEPNDPYRFWWDNHLVRIAMVYWFRHDSENCANCRDTETYWPCMPLPSSVLATRDNLSRLGTAVHWRIGDFANWAFDHDVMYETGKGKNRAIRFRRVSPERFASCTCDWCEERRAEAPQRAHEVHVAAVGYAFLEAGLVLLPKSRNEETA